MKGNSLPARRGGWPKAGWMKASALPARRGGGAQRMRMVTSPLAGKVARSAGWGGGPGIAAAFVLLVACNSNALPPAGTTAASPARVLVAAPDFTDQPSFAARTGRPPALSLQALFHPTFNVPLDPSKIRTLLVTGDIIPARGVNYFATIKHDFLWPFR